MSYDVHIVDRISGEQLHFDGTHDYKGGTYAVGGTTKAWINVTYNYGKLYAEIWGHGLYGFDDMNVVDVIPKLMEGIVILGTTKSEDYWEATKGNAGAALAGIVAIACHFPEGKLRIT